MSYDELVNLPHPCNGCKDSHDDCKSGCFDLFTYHNTYKKFNKDKKITPNVTMSKRQIKRANERLCRHISAGRSK